MVCYNKAEETRIQLSELAEQLKYVNRKMAILDYNSGMADAYDDGYKDGFEEWFKEGFEMKIKEIAIKMLKNKVPFDKIQLYTELSQAQVEQLAKENNLMP